MCSSDVYQSVRVCVCGSVTGSQSSLDFADKKDNSGHTEPVYFRHSENFR